jgi:hypothetical protein
VPAESVSAQMSVVSVLFCKLQALGQSKRRHLANTKRWTGHHAQALRFPVMMQPQFGIESSSRPSLALRDVPRSLRTQPKGQEISGLPALSTPLRVHDIPLEGIRISPRLMVCRLQAGHEKQFANTSIKCLTKKGPVLALVQVHQTYIPLQPTTKSDIG